MMKKKEVSISLENDSERTLLFLPYSGNYIDLIDGGWELCPQKLTSDIPNVINLSSLRYHTHHNYN